MGLRLTPSSDALFLTPPSGRPSLSPMTRVGVLSFDRDLSCFSSAGVQCFLAFLIYAFAILVCVS